MKHSYQTRFYGVNYNDPIHIEHWYDDVAGSGGCFLAGTLIHTAHGIKPIEKIKKGDLVVAFDRFGSIEHGVVVHTFEHNKAENNSDIYTFWLNNGTKLKCTGNHAIYTDQDVPFKQAQEFVVGENFYDVENNPVEITKISIALLKNKPSNFKTYNLRVNPHHTYVAGGIKVHNGGGGKSDQARTPVEGPNTLRSRAVAKVQEIISEGEVEGLINDGSSVFFDDTPLENLVSNGGSPELFTQNFENASFFFEEGTPDQLPMPGFEDVETEVQVGVEAVFGTPVIRAIPSNTDAARVTVIIPTGLYDTDLSTGDVTGHTVVIAIDRRLPAGVFEEVVEDTITGKAVAPYEVAYRIEAPTGFADGAWEVRLRRVSADETASTTKSSTFFSRFTAIQDIQIAYENTALVGITVDAKSTGGNVPVRSYDIKGIKVKIPDVYNPITRAYSGPWSGTFVVAWTDNPAWILYDLLVNERYGIGEFLDEATIDKFEFFEAAQYNDGLVDDGDGGLEPRFTFNGQIARQDDSWKVINSVASTMRAVVVPGPIVTILQDRPTDPVKLITKANVAGGLFTYTGTALSTRKTIAHVTFNDPNDRMLPKVVSIENTAGIERYGFNPVNIVAFGCTSEGQARRWGKWYLETELNNSELVVWNGGLEQADVLPGEVIKVMDTDYVGLQLAGRIAGGTTTTVELDREVTLAIGATYVITVVDEDAQTLEERTVTTPAGDVTSVSFASALPTSAANLTNNMWMLESDDEVIARQFRVLSIKEKEKGKFEIQALFYDPDKFARIEQGIVLEVPVYSDIPAQTSAPVTNIRFIPEPYTDPEFGTRVGINVTWEHTDQLAYQYQIQWRRNNGPYSPEIRVLQKEYRIDQAIPGLYEVFISAINIRGVTSPPVEALFAYSISGQKNFLEPPINLILAPDTFVGSPAVTSITNDLSFTWDANPANATLGGVGSPLGTPAIGQVAGYRILLKDDAFNVLQTVNLSRDQASVGSPVGQSFRHTFFYGENQGSVGGPHREINVSILTLDAQGLPSVDSLDRSFNNPTPSVLNNVLSSDGIGRVTVTFDKPTDLDYTGIVLHGSTSSGFTPGPTNVLFDGDSTFISISPTDSGFSIGDTVFFKVAAYDTFDKSVGNLTFSGEFSSDILDTPGVPSGSSFPGSPSEGDTFYNTTTNNLYTWNGSVWVVAGIEVVSLLPAPGDFIGQVVYLDTFNAPNFQPDKLYRWDGSWTSAVPTSDLDGQITETQIEDDAISTPKLQANSVTANEILTNTITAGEIRTGTITTSELAASTIVGGNIAAATIESEHIAVNTIVAGNIATNTITSDEMQANSIGTNELQANSVTATELVAGTITAASAILADAVITTAKIVNLDVTTIKIANGAITNIASVTVGSIFVPTAFAGTGNGDFPITGTRPKTYVTIASVPITIDNTSSEIIITVNVDGKVQGGVTPTNGGSEFIGARILRDNARLWEGLYEIGQSTLSGGAFNQNFAITQSAVVATDGSISGAHTYKLQLFAQVQGIDAGTTFTFNQMTLVVMEVKK